MEINQPIPALEGTQTNGTQINLENFKGHWLVVYFYPRDNTPGCTNEAKDFTTFHKDFDQRGAVIIGVSRDSIKSHQNFTQKYDLPFALIADQDEHWCQAFDVIKEKKLYGKTHMGIERSTFLFDPEGELVKQWRKVKVPGHVEEVLAHIPASP